MFPQSTAVMWVLQIILLAPLPDSAETLIVCDPRKEGSCLLGVQVDALVLQFLNYFLLPALTLTPNPPGCQRCVRPGWRERAGVCDTSSGGSVLPA